MHPLRPWGRPAVEVTFRNDAHGERPGVAGSRDRSLERSPTKRVVGS